MTYKEVIRILQAIKEHPSMGVYLPDEYEALDLAIKALKESPQGEWIPVKDLNNFIRTCREELFEKMKDYPKREFEIRENMLLNFEQIVKLASSKYEADMRVKNELNNELNRVKDELGGRE